MIDLLQSFYLLDLNKIVSAYYLLSSGLDIMRIGESGMYNINQSSIA